MSVEVTLPSLGVAILEATVVKWLKEEGQPVAKEEPIAEVESDKVSFEVVSPMDGVLLKRLCEVSGSSGERGARGRGRGGRTLCRQGGRRARGVRSRAGTRPRAKPEPAARVRATPRPRRLPKQESISRGFADRGRTAW
ncbi:MAG: biotin/lipoyl-containing protein [Anaerotruncus massiliensis (ex Togo et al. 2019)]